MSNQIIINLDNVVEMVIGKLTEPPNVIRPGKEDALRQDLIEQLTDPEDNVAEKHMANDILRMIIDPILGDSNHEMPEDEDGGMPEGMMAELMKALGGLGGDQGSSPLDD